MSSVIIYHNPRCGTSRNTLALLQEAGISPQVVEYLKEPLDKAGIQNILNKAGITAKELVRSKETLFSELNLGSDNVTEEQLIDAMVAHPILMNRPVVITEKGARLCRPFELVREIL